MAPPTPAADLLTIPTSPPCVAGLLRRFASLGYEAILLTPVLFIAAYVFLTLTQAFRTPVVHSLFQFWLLLVLASYFVYCWRRSGQTLAMKTWHLRVARQDGAPLSTREAVARVLLALWGLFLFGVGFWWGFVDRERQFLHDRLVGSRVFNTRPRSAARISKRHAEGGRNGGTETRDDSEPTLHDLPT
jgi:uncharacterized RDD family membrane protein YckC